MEKFKIFNHEISLTNKNIFLLTAIITIIALIFGYFYYKYSILYLDWVDRDVKEYALVRNDEEINGRIISYYEKKGEPLVILDDFSKIRFEYSENKKYPKPYLFNFLNAGDSISKKRNSDSLFIFRDKSIFYFILGKNLKSYDYGK
jgi:hypothetical protein